MASGWSNDAAGVSLIRTDPKAAAGALVARVVVGRRVVVVPRVVDVLVAADVDGLDVAVDVDDDEVDEGAVAMRFLCPHAAKTRATAMVSAAVRRSIGPA
jgi:hypothetical protein